MNNFILKYNEYIENRSKEKCSYCNAKITPKIIKDIQVSVEKFNIGLKYKCKCGESWIEKTNQI